MKKSIYFIAMAFTLFTMVSCGSSETPESVAEEQLELAKQKIKIEETPLFGDYISWQDIYNDAHYNVGTWFYGKENEIAPYGYRYDENNRKYSKEEIDEMRKKVKVFKQIRKDAEHIIDSLHMKKIETFYDLDSKILITCDTSKYTNSSGSFHYEKSEMSKSPNLCIRFHVKKKDPNDWKNAVLLVLDKDGNILKRCYNKSSPFRGEYDPYFICVVGKDIKNAVSFKII